MWEVLGFGCRSGQVAGRCIWQAVAVSKGRLAGLTRALSQSQFSPLSLSHPCPDPSQTAADTKFDDYKPKVAFFFPGQGAQTVGMAKEVAAEVPAAKELFDRASEVLGYDLLAVCAEGALVGPAVQALCGGWAVGWLAGCRKPNQQQSILGVALCKWSPAVKPECLAAARPLPTARPQGEAGLHRREPARHLCGQHGGAGEAQGAGGAGGCRQHCTARGAAGETVHPTLSAGGGV